jgi:hypothetical protein
MEQHGRGSSLNHQPFCLVDIRPGLDVQGRLEPLAASATIALHILKPVSTHRIYT